MIVTLKVLREKGRFDNQNALITEKKWTEEDFDFDILLYSQENWERHFPHVAKTKTFTDYITELAETPKNKTATLEWAASMLKALFCMFRNEKLISFQDFTNLFQTSDAQHNERLAEQFKKIFESMTANLTKNSPN